MSLGYFKRFSGLTNWTDGVHIHYSEDNYKYSRLGEISSALDVRSEISITH